MDVRSKHCIKKEAQTSYLLYCPMLNVRLDNPQWNLKRSLQIISAESEVEGLFGERPEALWVTGGGESILLHFPPAACIEEKQLLHF